MVKIITDSGSDLPLSTIEKYNIEIFPIATIDGENEYFIGKNIEIKEFYDNMRNNVVYNTSQVARGLIVENFERYAKEGIDAIYLPLSSGISGTYENAISAKDEVLEKYPEAKIFVINTKSATMGEGSIAIRAAILSQEGKTVEEIIEALEELIENQIDLFTVGDLEYLFRGGRLSKTSKIIGGLLNILPILTIEKEFGKLESIDKVRGKHAFIKKIFDWASKKSKNNEFNPNQTIVICHGDWEETAEKVKEYLIEEMKVEEKNIKIVNVGCVIGAHTGPEVLTLHFSKDPSIIPYFDI